MYFFFLLCFVFAFFLETHRVSLARSCKLRLFDTRDEFLRTLLDNLSTVTSPVWFHVENCNDTVRLTTARPLRGPRDSGTLAASV